MTHEFVLFLTGYSARTLAAAANLRRVCDDRLGPDGYVLTILDVLDHPDRADAARIIATPTVVRLVPVPRVRVIGDLSSLDQLAAALDLPSAPKETRE